jgi:hypothetical protein
VELCLVAARGRDPIKRPTSAASPRGVANSAFAPRAGATQPVPSDLPDDCPLNPARRGYPDRMPSSRPTALDSHWYIFAWRYRRFVLFSSPPARDVSCGSTWSFGSRDSSRQSTTETTGSLRFPSTPRVPTPCSRTPVGPNTPGHCGVSTRPPLVSTTEAPARNISRLNRTALGLAVYASQ